MIEKGKCCIVNNSLLSFQCIYLFFVAYKYFEYFTFSGKPVADVQAAVPAKSKAAAAAKEGTSAKPKVTLVDPKKEDSDDSEDSDEDSDDEVNFVYVRVALLMAAWFATLEYI